MFATRACFRNLHIFIIPFLILCNIAVASNKRLCGKELSATLEFICENNYNGFGKKSGKITLNDYFNEQNAGIDEDEDLPYPYNQMPFLAKIRGGSLQPKVRRIRHGVSDECCKKPCTYKELSSYCKYPQY